VDIDLTIRQRILEDSELQLRFVYNYNTWLSLLILLDIGKGTSRYSC
jgi:hypothetical protein